MSNYGKKIIIGLFLSVFISPAFASDWDLPGINIISRSERGADDSIRYSDLPYSDRKAIQAAKSEEEMAALEESDLDKFLDKQKAAYEKDMRNDYLNTNFADNQKVDKVTYQAGIDYLSRPQSYHYAKSKIIVHHTALDTSYFTGKNSVIGYLQDIYNFHTNKNGRGDIGYNFLIDPYGNIYEGRAGGDSVIGAHTLRNNTPSVGISLMGNFDRQKPTTAQIKSLVSLTAALSKKYNIDPTAKTEYHKEIKDSPYMKSVENYTIAGHRDAGSTSCPGKNLYSMLPKIRDMAIQEMAKSVLVSSSKVMDSLPTATAVKDSVSNTVTNTAKGLDMLKTWQPSFDKISQAIQKDYIKKHGTKIAITKTQKITAKISTGDIQKYLNSDISVLLYELSTKYSKRDLACSSKCSFVGKSNTYQSTGAVIEVTEGGLLLQINGEKYIESNINVQANPDSLIEIKNYPRVSYYKIPWNTFYGSLVFEKGKIKNLKTNSFDDQFIVVNKLPFSKYLKGIAETNDSEKKEKIKAMNLISKGYALFYKNPQNKHPSIPAGADYTAIDSPDIFQKYVGAGLEKTLKIVPALVEVQKNEIVLFDNYLPILPYFSCSAGFTRSAKDKRGRTDTPYLVSRVDIEKCADFNGHGVGLSGKGAQYFAQKGRSYKEILNYYYPGIKIVSL